MQRMKRFPVRSFTYLFLRIRGSCNYRNAYLVTFLFCLISHTVYAAPLGLPKSTAKIGYGIGGAHVSIDDPNGNTEDKWGVQPITLVYSDWLFSGFRHWAELYHYETSLDSSVTNVGQDVDRTGFRVSLQKNFRVGKTFSPWIGGGLDVSKVEYSVRHTKDSEGFLEARYGDRDEVAVSFVFNVMSEWSLMRDWSIGAKLEQSIAVESDISDTLATINLLFRY